MGYGFVAQRQSGRFTCDRPMVQIHPNPPDYFTPPKSHMTILFLTRLFHPHIGGVETHVFQISKRLIDGRHRIVVLTEKNEYKLHNKESVDGIEIYRIPVGKNEWFKKFQIWWWLWNHRFLIKKADIIHCHDVFFWYLPFRFLFFNKPAYTTFHGYESYPVSKKAITIRKISEILSWGNICIGDYIKKWYGTKPTHVSYGGVDISSSHRSFKNKYSAVFIGRLDEQTGILTYTDAVEIIKKKIPNFDFLAIGDGELKNKISRKVKIYEALDNASDYFQKYNFAFVSRYLSILEAMAAKRLVFAVYDNPLKEDYLRITPCASYMIICLTSDELASQVLYYLKHSKEEKVKIDQAYKWVKKQTWENVISLYLKLWNK